MIIIKVDHTRCKRTFRLLYRVALAIAVSLLFLSGGWVAWQRVRDRVLIPRLGKYLASQVEQRLGWHLTYRSISGNLLTTLSLEEVQLEPPHSVIPQELVLAADRLHAHYSPLSLMRGRIKQLDVRRPRLIVGITEIALVMSYTPCKQKSGVRYLQAIEPVGMSVPTHTGGLTPWVECHRVSG